ncbi:MAG: tRNA uridine-5-carboxymethylaminomethyl(34) synthesis enzyme MnmG [Planctomycetes bacterium]|nr:tRNA uridine-5-carboxymethylaminomethyl(34) synthesis enzyme MnmG [Planctomycetota bacterium]
MVKTSFDVLVVGGGHAGVEAACAAARLGAFTGLISLSEDALGRMSCNPAIGGIGKGQLAREVDALGGLMGLATDAAGIQFRMLNTSKGRAVQSPRAQCARDPYERAIQSMVADQDHLQVIQGEAVDFLFHGDGKSVRGLVLADGREILAQAVILTTGTFLEGILHTGLEQVEGGRVTEGAAHHLGEALRRLGLGTGRMKTGTPPRIASDSVVYSVMQEQPGDAVPEPFSFLTERIEQPQISCWLTQTSQETHDLVRANLASSPMHVGNIDGAGARYCPSLEDKVVRFSERNAHTVFLEPEDYDSPLLYANGISTSLPADIQQQFVQTIRGMKHARIVQPGYAVEYTYVQPNSLRRTLETRDFPGLYLAGQICGTSGYEEAACQGLMAGLNAARKLAQKDPVILGRHEAYIGVLIDDLVVCNPSEPYRMFTSRAEHRLLLRHDTADRRLTDMGPEWGSVGAVRLAKVRSRQARLEIGKQLLKDTFIDEMDSGGRRRTLMDVVRRPEGGIAQASKESSVIQDSELSDLDWATIEADVRYEGYVRRQQDWIERAEVREAVLIPDEFDFSRIAGLRNEAVESLSTHRPQSLGAAGRLAGVSPADVALVEVSLARIERAKEMNPST